MINKFWNLPLRKKISLVYIFANVLIFIVSIILIYGINGMSVKMDMVYQENRELNELSLALDGVQDSMTQYLKAKTSDDLEEYYICDQRYDSLIQELNTEVTDMSFDRMEKNIREMSEDYLSVVRQTIEAKRGRNVEKYRVRYESATELYGYISEYIAALNQELFKNNSESYAELSRAFRMFERITIVVMTAVIIGNIIIITSLIKSIISPLGKLADTAYEVANGNLDTELLEVSSMDEIGVVTNAFNKMVTSIRDYIDRLKKSMDAERELQERELMMEAHLKDAQLRYLQAQINPHFLFNTLNAGAQLAMMEGADKTYEYVQTVADFFRYNVKKQDKPVTIAEEVELVDNYIEILNVRFSGDIKYDKQVDESLLNVNMPSMILQPVVENCVNHGIREMGDQGRITLKVYSEEEYVCISIKDNGKGMDEETIQKILSGTIKEEAQKKEGGGIGMDNVIARTRLFTGNEDCIEIYSDGEGMGTEVVIRIPEEKL